jgi:hypothetical protein
MTRSGDARSDIERRQEPSASSQIRNSFFCCSLNLQLVSLAEVPMLLRKRRIPSRLTSISDR